MCNGKNGGELNFRQKQNGNALEKDVTLARKVYNMLKK